VTIAGEVRYVRAVDDREFNMGILARYTKPDGVPHDALDLTLVFYPEVAP